MEDIRLTYKNVSDKNISAIRFKWYGENSFGEPADMGNYNHDGFGAGYDDEGLRKGRTVTNQWSILSRDARKVVDVWPYEVVFADGSRWKTSTN